MAWMTVRNFFATFLVAIVSSRLAAGVPCGYPGSPVFGRPIPVRESYNPGDAVSFSCGNGYALQGAPQRVCLENGTWAGPAPLCDRSLSGLDQLASSRATLVLYPADRVVDGNRQSCAYTEKRKPRWFRVDLRGDHKVRSVLLTVPPGAYREDPAQFTIYVISVKDSTTASYHKCAHLNGKFSTSTVKLQCAGGGITGRYVHLEDNRNDVNYFSACEVEVFVQRDTYECGEAERPAHSYDVVLEAGLVEYHCVHGYRLQGAPTRQCLPSGQWSGEQPLCVEIVCPLLPELNNGRIAYTGPTRGRPVLGTMANASCNPGFQAAGPALRCLETGRWSPEDLACLPVDCGAPEVRSSSDRYILANGSSIFGSVAFLFCGNIEERDVDEVPVATLLCREDESWTPHDVDCRTRDMLATLGLVDEEDNAVSNGIIVGMAVVVFFLLLLMIFILLLRRKGLLRRGSTESLPSKGTASTLGGSESDPKAGSCENDAFYASIALDGINDSASKTDVVKSQGGKVGALSTILFAKRSGGRGNKGPPSEDSSPVYAQVDLDGKRRSRLARALAGHLGGDQGKPKEDSRSLGPHCPFDHELDSEPIRLRELPPIPDDDSGTYASLSRAPEPPPGPLLMRENAIYAPGEPLYDLPTTDMYDSSVVIMKDNDLYLSR